MPQKVAEVISSEPFSYVRGNRERSSAQLTGEVVTLGNWNPTDDPIDCNE